MGHKLAIFCWIIQNNISTFHFRKPTKSLYDECLMYILYLLTSVLKVWIVNIVWNSNNRHTPAFHKVYAKRPFCLFILYSKTQVFMSFVLFFPRITIIDEIIFSHSKKRARKYCFFSLIIWMFAFEGSNNGT